MGLYSRKDIDPAQTMSATAVQSARNAKSLSLPTLQSNADPYGSSAAPMHICIYIYMYIYICIYIYILHTIHI